MSQPTTPAGRLLLRNFDVHVKGIADDMTEDQLVAAIVAIESDAREDVLAKVGRILDDFEPNGALRRLVFHAIKESE